MPSAPVKKRTLFAYGAIAMPLAAAGLPIYIHIPHFYASQFGIDLALLGVVLLAVRIIDTVQDPLLGLWSDRLSQRGVSRTRMLGWSLPVFGVAMFLLVEPLVEKHILWWLVASITLLYTAYSMLAVNYYALGAEMSHDYKERGRINAWREGGILVGIMVASAAPGLLDKWLGNDRGLLVFGAAMAVLSLLLIPIISLTLAQVKKTSQQDDTDSSPGNWSDNLRTAWQNKSLRWMIAFLLVNGLANSVPATLILFYIEDVLVAKSNEGIFLLLYFLAGVLAMPLWVKLSEKVGRKKALMWSLSLSVLVFFPAGFLGQGDAEYFYIVCIVVGAALGADLALPPAMMADVAESKGQGSGFYYGVWNVIWKLTFALSAGIALPALAWLGYDPSGDNTDDALRHVAYAYALWPCVLKLLAVWVLWRSPLDRTFKEEAS